jgi:outer membrane protein assembly factor BamB
MKTTRLAWLGAALCLCGGLRLGIDAHAQDILPPGPPLIVAMGGGEPRQDSPFVDRVRLPIDPRVRRNYREAQRLVESKDWPQAIHLLQSLLDSKEDNFIEATEGEAKGRRISIRSEANRLLSSLPREGKQYYEQQYGAQAKALLRKGVAANDPQIFAEIALRFLHTDAGSEAAALLGSYHLDHGQYIVAALCFERLMDRENGLQRMTPLDLYKAALAFERAGDAKNRQRAWDAFQAKADQVGEKPLPASLRRLTPKELEAGLAASKETRLALGRDDWPMFMGSADRSAQGIGGVPFLDAHSFMLDLNKPLVATRRHSTVAKGQILEAALKQQHNRNRPIMPGFQPLAVGNDLIYRSHWGIHAYSLKDRVPRWEQPFTVSLHALFGSEGSSEVDKANQFHIWKDNYLQHAPWLFYNNSLQGSLSTDQTLVYAIEDLAVPNIPQADVNIGRGMPRGNPGSDTLAPWYAHNKLVAIELSTGLVAWDIGSAGNNSPFAETFFLGPPLPLGGKLYVLAETNREIRLLCLETRPAWLGHENPPREGHKVELVWAQTLCTVEVRLADDPVRRAHAAHLSYGDGLLICPTNAGMILGVDLLTRTLVWADSYQVDKSGEERGHELPQAQFGGGRRGVRFGGPMGEPYLTGPLNDTVWQSSVPMVQQGHVIFTAYDSDAVHCLRLRDGTHVWKHNRNDEREGNFIYLAGVFEGKVLLVGPKSCRALNLTDGKVLWTLPTGMPCGRGVASGGQYFLPLQSGEVWALDLAKGEVVSKSKSRKEKPGNLVFHDGDVLSQNVMTLTCYPQLEIAEKKITARLQANPDDPVGLSERGKIRLYRGNASEAVADLRRALTQPSLDAILRQDTQEKLYEALCDLLDKDFIAHEAELPALEKLIPLPVTGTEEKDAKDALEVAQLERRVNLLRLVAKGRVAQHRMADALATYLTAADLKQIMIRIPEDRTVEVVPVEWAIAKLRTLLEDSPAPRREALLQAIDQQWSRARAVGSLDALRRFANFFQALCPEGRDAQLMVAQNLMAQPDLKSNFPEAISRLHTLLFDSDPRRAAQAREALARLDTRLGSLMTAAFHYRILATKYPRVIVRDGKTGEELYLELATDKRFLPYLDELKPGGGGSAALEYEGKLEPRPMEKGVPHLIWADIPEETFPFRLAIDLSRKEAVLYEARTGRQCDSFRLLQQEIIADFSMGGGYDPPAASPTVHLLAGQVMLFTWGRHVYAYDPFIKRGLLWTYDLLNNVTEEHPAYQMGRNPQQMVFNNGQVRLVRASGVQEVIGAPAVAGGQGVCFVVREKGLVMVDAFTGKERWVREAVPTNVELFSDGEQVYVYSPPQADGTLATSQALRCHGGTDVPVPPFAAHYQRKKDAFGRHLLLQDADAAGAVTVRLYDVRTGQDSWKQTFAPKAIMLNSLVRQTVGAVDPDGRVRVFDLPSGQTVLQTYLAPPHLKEVKECHLLRDAETWYVACNRHPTEEGAKPAGPMGIQVLPAPGQTVLRPAGSLSFVPVEGPLLACERDTGRLLWQAELPKQHLITNQFADVPLLIGVCGLVTRPAEQKNPGNPQAVRRGFQKRSTEFLALDKRTGQCVFEDQKWVQITFDCLQLDHRNHSLKLHSFQGNSSYTLVFQGKVPTAGEKHGAGKP